ncbi:glutaredoxin family protein [Oceanobacillus chungangensis]|uniref:NrdH-redoxin n=1 Tax=Oceanobacillus chungangensis TaxID=1229152 RepID=A0A3D8PHW9_9BACI|nr:glutaredoxin family protein [Oceanobacillus chungangensis]RDW15077.1 NrdH-redoxin [Oceanobacillus chungangensis]
MSNKNVIIYISEDNPHCSQVLKLMDTLEVRYKTKNVTKDGQYLQELQSKGIFGTPATFIEDRKYPILGFQKEKLISALRKRKSRSN